MENKYFNMNFEVGLKVLLERIKLGDVKKEDAF